MGIKTDLEAYVSNSKDSQLFSTQVITIGEDLEVHKRERTKNKFPQNDIVEESSEIESPKNLQKRPTIKQIYPKDHSIHRNKTVALLLQNEKPETKE